LAEELAGQFGVPVKDETGLTGMYDLDLKTYEVKGSDRRDDETNLWPPPQTAIHDELGLNPIPSHELVRISVIDHTELPSPD
jgi:uncharacterized protein (TIGR03435 family)